MKRVELANSKLAWSPHAPIRDDSLLHLYLLKAPVVLEVCFC